MKCVRFSQKGEAHSSLQRLRLKLGVQSSKVLQCPASFNKDVLHFNGGHFPQLADLIFL